MSALRTVQPAHVLHDADDWYFEHPTEVHRFSGVQEGHILWGCDDNCSIYPEVVQKSDSGTPYVVSYPDSEVTKVYNEIAEKCTAFVEPPGEKVQQKKSGSATQKANKKQKRR